MQTSYNGAVEGIYSSLPFGDGYSASGTDDDAYHFAMLDQDVNDNDHAQYREYSSMTGRWMSPDPYSGSYNFADPQSFNRYAYVMNNPMSYVDPLGLFDQPLVGCVLDIEPSYVDGGFTGYLIWGIVTCSGSTSGALYLGSGASP